MDTTSRTTSYDQSAFDEAFASLPEGVENFMWSDEYEQMIAGIQQSLTLTPEQGALVKTNGYELLSQLKDMEAVAKEFIEAGFSQELATKTLYLFDKIILQPLAKVILENPPESEEEDATASKIDETAAHNIPTEIHPNEEVFSSLRARMTQSATIAPIVRSVTTPSRTSESPSSATPTTPAPAQHIDPYRELPE